MVVQAVMGNGVQPGGEAWIGLPAFTRRDHALPDILEDFIGQPVVAQLAQQVAVKLPAMARVQLVERTYLARRVRKHQGFVADIQAFHPRQTTDWRLCRKGRQQRSGEYVMAIHAIANASEWQKGLPLTVPFAVVNSMLGA